MATQTQNPKVGRPKFNLQYPRGIFTVADLYDLNRGERGRGKRAKVCKLTVRTHIDDQLAAGFLTQVENVKSGKVGKPAAQFIRSAVKAGLESARAARQTVNETPVSTVTVNVDPTDITSVPADSSPSVPVLVPAGTVESLVNAS